MPLWPIDISRLRARGILHRFQVNNSMSGERGQSSHQAVSFSVIALLLQLFGRLCYGSRRVLRYSMSLNPATTVLFRAEDLSQPITKPASGILTILTPTLDIWEVRQSNGPFVTVLDVVVEIYKRRSNFMVIDSYHRIISIIYCILIRSPCFDCLYSRKLVSYVRNLILFLPSRLAPRM